MVVWASVPNKDELDDIHRNYKKGNPDLFAAASKRAVVPGGSV